MNNPFFFLFFFWVNQGTSSSLKKVVGFHTYRPKRSPSGGFKRRTRTTMQHNHITNPNDFIFAPKLDVSDCVQVLLGFN